MLRLRRGRVVEAPGGAGSPLTDAEQELVVELEDGGRHPAIADTGLVGTCATGDEVIVNVLARELGLGSGGFDIVHVNLTRGLDAPLDTGAHVLKLNYTSLQHAVAPVEEGGATAPAPAAPVGVLALHGQLPALAWAHAQAGGGPLGYVQTAGGALPASHSRVVRELLARGLLAAHVSVAPCFGAPHGEAISVVGALSHGLTELGWSAAVCGPGPGIVGSASPLGHGGMAAFDSANAALALGASTLLVPRMSEADPRERHRGVSHHTRTVLELLRGRGVVVALPQGASAPAWGAGLEWREAPANLSGYESSGLPVLTMGRSDPLFFRAALAGGALLARPVKKVP